MARKLTIERLDVLPTHWAGFAMRQIFSMCMLEPGLEKLGGFLQGNRMRVQHHCNFFEVQLLERMALSGYTASTYKDR